MVESKKKQITETKGWKWFWGIYGLCMGIVLISMGPWFGGLLIIIGTLLLMPYFGEKISKLAKLELSKMARTAIFVGIIVTMILSFVLMNSSPAVSESKLSKDLSNLNPNVFFLSGSDLSTEWHYGKIGSESVDTPINGITPIGKLSQTNAKTDGLTADGIYVTVYEFNTTNDANAYYNSTIQEIIFKRGFTEINYNMDNCFIVDKSNYTMGYMLGNCVVGKYILKLSYTTEYDSVSSGEFKSILSTILNRVYN